MSKPAEADLPEGPPPIAVISGSTTILPSIHLHGAAGGAGCVENFHHQNQIKPETEVVSIHGAAADGCMENFHHQNHINMVSSTTAAAGDSLALSETELVSMPTTAATGSSEPDAAEAVASESASSAEEIKSIKTNSCSSVSGGMTIPDHVAIVLVHSEVKSSQPAELTVDLTTE